jgi:hypothetical protein
MQAAESNTNGCVVLLITHCALHAPCSFAEQHREEEEHAALVLQSCWRGRLQRQEVEKLRWEL